MGLMNLIPFAVPHPRPRRLSDPFGDFCDESLARLLDTPDDQLRWNHFKQLLGPFLPAGNYEEIVYFLPFAFNCLLEDDESELELVTPIV
jgi:hypothetical protein